MMRIRLIKELRAKPIEVEVEEGITIEELVGEYKEKLEYRVLAAKKDNDLVDLREKITKPCEIEFLDMRTQAANAIYEKSISLIYLKAVNDVLPEAKVIINCVLNKGLYTQIIQEDKISDSQIDAIAKRMRELVEQDLPILKHKVTPEEGKRIMKEDGEEGKLRIMESKTLNSATFYTLDGYRNFFYSLMVPSTGYIEYFELRKYYDGVLIRYPHPKDPKKIPDYVDEVKMAQVLHEADQWGNLMGINYVSDLNEKVKSGEIKEIVQLSEALHEKKIAEIADMIKVQKKRIILIAGPSSSGKTTFAKRLCIQLKVNGLNPLYLGTDDYFVEREDTPIDEHGEKDFERLEAVDVPLFNAHLNALLKGETVDLPTFDFLEGTKRYGDRKISIKADQPIVIEGIHALNGELTPDIAQGEKFKIYISPLTQLNVDEHNRISTTDSRMIRRMVRDYKYRGHDAKRTIRDWPKVRKGEDKYIFPYNGEADVFFNSVHIYEFAVLKKYAEPLLRGITPEDPEYMDAHRMLKFLKYFLIAENDEIIVNNSILREFIGGSIFVE